MNMQLTLLLGLLDTETVYDSFEYLTNTSYFGFLFVFINNLFIVQWQVRDCSKSGVGRHHMQMCILEQRLTLVAAVA